MEDEIEINGRKYIAEDGAARVVTQPGDALDAGMIGKYVICRCRDAGVHAGVLVAQQGREAVLSESRRLYYWKVAGERDFLSGVSQDGLHSDSKVGCPIEVHLTEVCEIITCSKDAEQSIRDKADHGGQ